MKELINLYKYEKEYMGKGTRTRENDPATSIKRENSGIGARAASSRRRQSSICPNSKPYYPINPQSGSRLRAGPFSGGTASFSQQIPKVICERSCRKAKTLTVKITHKIEKKSTTKNFCFIL